jgi:magnesium-dependent phosphatase 1
MMRPRVVVFDLDGLLWSPEMYQLWGGGGPPFTQESPHVLRDARGTKVSLLGGELDSVIAHLQSTGARLGIASSTDEPGWARECLNKFTVLGCKLAEHFEEGLVVIEKDSKRTHLCKIAARAGVPMSAILFLDNELGNVQTVRPLGVHAVHVPHGGVTVRVLQQALDAMQE